MEFFTTIKDGKIQANTGVQIKDFIRTMEGKRVVFKIEKVKSIRSLQQNKYYHVCKKILSDEIGYDVTELHEIIKYKFLTKEKVDEKTGEVYNFVGSTTKLNKSEFADFVSDLQRWAIETFNVYLPSAVEQLTIN